MNNRRPSPVTGTGSPLRWNDIAALAGNAFSQVLELAEEIFGVRAAVVSLVDSNGHWRHFPEAGARWLDGRGVALLERARCDRRTCLDGADGEKTDGEIAFHVAQPIPTPKGDGRVRGALSLVDTHSRSLSESERRRLERFAVLAAEKIDQQLILGGGSEAPAETCDPDGVDGHYRSFYENAVEGFYRTTIAGDYLRANLSLARMYRYASVEKMIESSNFSARRLYVENGRRDEFVRRMDESGAISGFESEVRRADGTTFWISESARVIRDGTGEILFFEGTVTDITARKEAEAELRASRAELEERVRERTAELREQMERFDRLIGNIPGMVYQVLLSPGGEAHYTYVNEGVTDIFDVSVDDVMAGRRDPMRMGHIEDAKSLARSIAHSIDTLGPWRWVGRIVTDTGEVKWIHAQSRPMKRADGYVVWDGVVTEVTELHRTKHALRRTQQQQSAILNASPDGILTVDAEDRILGINPAAERTLGALEKTLAGKRMRDVFSAGRVDTHAGDASDDFPGVSSSTLTGKRNELAARRADGSPFPVELTVAPASTDGETFFTVNMRDISGRKRFEQRLRESRDEAQRANRAKNEFLSRMSHELRTPLNAILGFSQLLLRRETDEKKAEKIGFIQRAGRHLLDLINEVLDLARIESGRLCCSIEDVDLGDIFREVAAFAGSTAHESEISLALDEAAADGVLISADQQRLKQILLNLVTNAIKYNHAGGSVAVECRPSGEDRVEISVRDTGVGIPAKRLKDLFTPFERLGTELGDIEGTGIGLALSQSLAELMGARIEVESALGEGSRFSLKLPRATPAEQDADRAAAPAPREEAPAHQRGTDANRAAHHLLYIEDNPINLRLVEDLVAECDDWKMSHAVNGADGLAIARETRPDLVFLDLHLPDMTGERVLRKLRDTPELGDATIVIVTADAMHRSFDSPSRRRPDRLLTKPIDVAEVVELLDTVAAEREGLPS